MSKYSQMLRESSLSVSVLADEKPAWCHEQYRVD